MTTYFGARYWGPRYFGRAYFSGAGGKAYFGDSYFGSAYFGRAYFAGTNLGAPAVGVITGTIGLISGPGSVATAGVVTSVPATSGTLAPAARVSGVSLAGQHIPPPVLVTMTLLARPGVGGLAGWIIAPVLGALDAVPDPATSGLTGQNTPPPTHVTLATMSGPAAGGLLGLEIPRSLLIPTSLHGPVLDITFLDPSRTFHTDL